MHATPPFFPARSRGGLPRAAPPLRRRPRTSAPVEACMRHPLSRPPVLVAASAVLLTACVAEDGGEGGAAAQDYPADDITLYVPYAPGGPTDLAARTVGDCLAEDFGRNVVVENREGASGSLGMQAMIEGGTAGDSLVFIAGAADAADTVL